MTLEHADGPPFISGDRVWLMLPTNPRRFHLSQRRFDGTVTAVGSPLADSVRIDLDHPCNGITWCTASAREVHLVD